MLSKLVRWFRRRQAQRRADDLEAAARLYHIHGMYSEAQEMALLASVHRAVVEELE